MSAAGSGGGEAARRGRPENALLPLVAASWLLRSGDVGSPRWVLGVLLAVVGLTLAVHGLRGLLREQQSWSVVGLLGAMAALVLTRLVASVSGT